MKTPSALMVDSVGRIVLPKPIRRQFHLERGSTLKVEIESDAIILRPHLRLAALTEEGGLLVHEGDPTGDLMNAVSSSRSRRDALVTGPQE